MNLQPTIQISNYEVYLLELFDLTVGLDITI